MNYSVLHLVGMRMVNLISLIQTSSFLRVVIMREHFRAVQRWKVNQKLVVERPIQRILPSQGHSGAFEHYHFTCFQKDLLTLVLVVYQSQWPFGLHLLLNLQLTSFKKFLKAKAKENNPFFYSAGILQTVRADHQGGSSFKKVYDICIAA